MKVRPLLILSIFLAIIHIACDSPHSTIISEITCENKVEPLGTPLTNISFSWKMTSAKREQYQTAYQLVIASSESRLRGGDYDILNTGKKESRKNVLVMYDGKPLEPAAEYFWKVKVWDKDGQESAWSETGRFITGLFSEEDWNGAAWTGIEELPDSLLLVPGEHYINNEAEWGEDMAHIATRRPVIPLFRKDFNVDKKVKSAILFISGLGHYEASLNGENTETWQPKFTYTGFRYLQVENASHKTFSGASGLPVIKDAKLLHVRNSAPATGNFSCSHELFNQIFDLINWAIKSNFMSVLTDCPHREKLGWLEQTHLMGSSIHYNFNLHTLYRQKVYNMMDSQLPNGLVPNIAPEYVEFIGAYRDSPEWGSASVILPWLIYKLYGDKTIIEEAWSMIYSYISYLGSTADNHIVSHGLGDWYDLGPNPPGFAQLTPRELTATATYYYVVNVSSKMAELIGLTKKAEELTLLGKEIRQAFIDNFYDREAKTYSTGSQTAMAMPLYLGLVPDDDREAAFANLVKSVEDSGKALTTGNVGFFYLIRMLTEADASELIFEMNNRTDVPGYGYQLERGATALTEAWAAHETSSHNHLMLGHIMDWFYGGLAGIRQAENSSAYRNILIEPHFIDEIQWVNADFETPYGKIVSNWERKRKHITLNVSIPVNTTAEIIIPVSSADMVTEGRRSVGNMKEINIAGHSQRKLVLLVGSGEYKFRFEPES